MKGSSAMRIKVTDQSKEQKIKVHRVGVLVGQTMAFIHNLHTVRAIDRAILRDGRIVWIGGKNERGRIHGN